MAEWNAKRFNYVAGLQKQQRETNFFAKSRARAGGLDRNSGSVRRYSKLCNAIATAQSDINFNGPERRHLWKWVSLISHESKIMLSLPRIFIFLPFFFLLFSIPFRFCFVAYPGPPSAWLLRSKHNYAALGFRKRGEPWFGATGAHNTHA